MSVALANIALTILAPLFAATSARKKKSIAKPARRKSAKVARPKTAKRPVKKQPTARAKSKKVARPKKPAPPGRGKLPVQPTKIAQPIPTEPMPKPLPPSGRAILLSPENEKFTDSLHPAFRWLSVGGATRYEVTWSEHPSFSSLSSVVSIATEATVPVERTLRMGSTYYWRVRGGNEGGWGPWSASSSFRVLESEE